MKFRLIEDSDEHIDYIRDFANFKDLIGRIDYEEAQDYLNSHNASYDISKIGYEDEHNIQKEEFRHIIDDIITSVSPKQARAIEIFILRTLSDYTLRDIGCRYCVSGTRIGQLAQKGANILKSELQKRHYHFEDFFENFNISKNTILSEELENNFKYTVEHLYHKGKVSELRNSPMWFADDSEMTHGSDDGEFHTYTIGFNNPLEIECHYYDYDEIPLDTKSLKLLGLYKSEFGNKYDYVPDDEDYYNSEYPYGGNPDYDIYSLSSDEIVNIGFKLEYDCIILNNINELQFHYASSNTDYIVKDAKSQVILKESEN